MDANRVEEYKEEDLAQLSSKCAPKPNVEEKQEEFRHKGERSGCLGLIAGFKEPIFMGSCSSWM
ncbi:hypothetical protein V6N12_020668 [Hibiscus sabdariffa]|uniref:Uncharacterized protein n=1 Tax=Hibiscus sabdariffa TaxID=183260 RepID=A0ABR2CZ40_9ROSI